MVRRALGGAALMAAAFVIPIACSEFESTDPPLEGGTPDAPGSSDAGVDRALPPVVPPIVVTATSSAPRVLVGESVEVTIAVKRDGDDGFKGPVHIEMAPLADVAATGLDIPAEATSGKTTVVFTPKRKHGRLPLAFKATSAGSPSTGEARVSVVARGPAGSLDNGFGTDGVFSLGTPSKGTGVALVGGNKIVFGGSINNQAAIVRVLEDGAPDTTFGTMGRFTKSLTSFESTGEVAVDPMGNAFLAVSADVGFGQNALVLGVLANGTVNAKYGSQGIARTSGFRAAAVAWTSAGLFVGGKANAVGGMGFVAQLTPDGSGLLPAWGYKTFGDNTGICKDNACYVRSISVDGKGVPSFASSRSDGCEVHAKDMTINTSLRVDDCGGVAFDAVDRIYVAGRQYGTAIVYRFLADGTEDYEGWGADRARAPKPAWEGEVSERVIVQKDGSVVAAASPTLNGHKVFGAFRMKANGELDTSLTPDGCLYKEVGQTNVRVRSMAIDGEGRILLVGDNGELVAVRFWQ